MRGRIPGAAGAAVLVMAAGLGAARAAEPAIGCAGPFGKDASFVSLKKAFGAANVKNEKIDGAEGESTSGTVVYPDDPARRIEVLWQDEKARAHPSSVTLRGETATAVAPGVHVGLDLAGLEALNGKPFSLSGFGWDMGGYVTDWKDGALSKLAGGCFLSVQMNPAEDASERTMKAVSGDRTLGSADKAMRAARPTVSSVSLGWPQAETPR